MFEKKYKIIDSSDEILASNMSLESAMVFIKGFVEMYYMEPLNLRIVEIVPVKKEEE